MPKMTEKALQARDAKRDIGAELLQSVRDLKAGRWGRKTTIETMPGGTVRRRVELPDGTVAKDEVLTGHFQYAQTELFQTRRPWFDFFPIQQIRNRELHRQPKECFHQLPGFHVDQNVGVTDEQ
jgi:hypothetical protein